MNFESKDQLEEVLAGAIADMIITMIELNLRLKHGVRRFKRRFLYSRRTHQQDELLNELYKDVIQLNCKNNERNSIYKEEK